MFFTNVTPAEALDLGCRIAAVALGHRALQLIVCRHDFAAGGLIDLRLTQLRVGSPLDEAHRRLVAKLPMLRGALVPVATIQLLSAATLLWYPRGWLALALALGSDVFLQPWMRSCMDGGDEMLRVVTAALLFRAIDSDPRVQAAAATFLALQAALAYTVSGVSKAQSRMWWNGSAIHGIVSTQYFGVPFLARLVDSRRWIPIAVGLAMVLWESSFALSLLAGTKVTLGALCLAAAFHLCSGLVMGLDGFLLPFLATFPSVFYLAQQVSSAFSPLSRLAIAAVVACMLTGWLSHWRAATTVRS